MEVKIGANRSTVLPKIALISSLVIVLTLLFSSPAYSGIGELIDSALNAVISVVCGWILGGIDWILDQFLSALGADLTKMVQTLPGLEALTNIIMAVGIGLAILIGVWQIFRSFTNVISEEQLESPVRTLMRMFIFVPLTLFSKRIAEFVLSMVRIPYNWLLNPETSGITNGYSNTGLSAMANSMKDAMSNNFDFAGMLTIGTILGTVLSVMIAWNLLKMLLEATERYVVCGALVYLSPLAFATGTSRATAHILSSWASMFAGQAVLLLLNVWCIKVAITAIIGLASANDLILWMLIVLAFLKVSQNMDEIMSTLGISVSRTGRNMLDDIMATTVSMSRMSRAFGGGGKLDGGKAPVGSHGATGGQVSFTKPNSLPSPQPQQAPGVGQRVGAALKSTPVGKAAGAVAATKGGQMVGRAASAIGNGAQKVGNAVGFDKSPIGLAGRGISAVGSAAGHGINALAGTNRANMQNALSYMADSKDNAATSIQDYLNGGAAPGGLTSTMSGGYDAADATTSAAANNLNQAFSGIAGSDSRFDGGVQGNPDLKSVQGLEFAKNDEGQNVVRAHTAAGHSVELSAVPSKDGHSVPLVSTTQVPSGQEGRYNTISKNTGAYIKVINKPK